MPLRPFPYQLGIGTDIVHVDRIRAILLKDASKPGYLDRFLKRFLTLPERNEFKAIRHRATEDELNIRSRHLAGRWAAKEAAIKAVSWRRLGFHDIVIQRSSRGNGVFAIILDRAFKERKTVDIDGVDRATSQTADGLKRTAPDHEAGSISQISAAETSDILGEHRTGSLESSGASTNHDDLDTSDRENLLDPNDSIDSMSGQIAKISISHDGDYATAVCLAAEEPLEGDVGGEAAAREPP